MSNSLSDEGFLSTAQIYIFDQKASKVKKAQVRLINSKSNLSESDQYHSYGTGLFCRYHRLEDLFHVKKEYKDFFRFSSAIGQIISPIQEYTSIGLLYENDPMFSTLSHMVDLEIKIDGENNWRTIRLMPNVITEDIYGVVCLETQDHKKLHQFSIFLLPNKSIRSVQFEPNLLIENKNGTKKQLIIRMNQLEDEQVNIGVIDTSNLTQRICLEIGFKPEKQETYTHENSPETMNGNKKIYKNALDTVKNPIKSLIKILKNINNFIFNCFLRMFNLVFNFVKTCCVFLDEFAPSFFKEIPIWIAYVLIFIPTAPICFAVVIFFVFMATLMPLFGLHYLFTKKQHGNSTAEVINDEHIYQSLLKTFKNAPEFFLSLFEFIWIGVAEIIAMLFYCFFVCIQYTALFAAFIIDLALIPISFIASFISVTCVYAAFPFIYGFDRIFHDKTANTQEQKFDYYKTTYTVEEIKPEEIKPEEVSSQLTDDDDKKFFEAFRFAQEIVSLDKKS